MKPYLKEDNFQFSKHIRGVMKKELTKSQYRSWLEGVIDNELAMKGFSAEVMEHAYNDAESYGKRVENKLSSLENRCSKAILIFGMILGISLYLIFLSSI